MTTYSEIKIGQNFTVENSDEFSFTKLRDGARVNETGISTSFPDDELVYPFGDEPQLHEQVTEVERVAVTLIAMHNAAHPVLVEWANALAHDPDERRPLYRYAWEERERIVNDENLTLETLTRGRGFAYPTKLFDHDVDLHGLIIDHEPCGEYSNRDPEQKKINHQHRNNEGGYFDPALLYLCDALVTYREMGRPDGDHTETVFGMGHNPLMSVSTSLAAAIVEYHQQMLSLRANIEYLK